MFQDFIKLEMLQVFIVAVSVTVLLTQFFKEAVDKVCSLIKCHIPTKYVVFVWALVIVFLPLYFQQAITPEVIATGIINAILLSLTAMKSYETILEKAIIKIPKE